MASPFRQLYECGPYRLDASERQLWRGAEAVHLTPKELDTLSALVRGAGRLMSKEELLKEIWPDTFVGEATLAQNVFTLRRALGRTLDSTGLTLDSTPPADPHTGAGRFELESVASQASAVNRNGAGATVGASDTRE